MCKVELRRNRSFPHALSLFDPNGNQKGGAHSSDKVQAVREIRMASTSINPEDSAKFIEFVERELQSLHEGNIARYQLRPQEFQAWKEAWN